MASTEDRPVGEKQVKTSEGLSESPLGEAYLMQMTAEVTNCTQQAAKRYASLAKYTMSLEDMNRRLEARTDRSLKLAEVYNSSNT